MMCSAHALVLAGTLARLLGDPAGCVVDTEGRGMAEQTCAADGEAPSLWTTAFDPVKEDAIGERP